MSMPDVRQGNNSLAIVGLIALAMILLSLVIVFLSSRDQNDRIVMIGQPHDKQTGSAYYTQIGTPERLNRPVRTTTTQPPAITEE